MYSIELDRTVGRRSGSEFSTVAQGQVTKDSHTVPPAGRGASSKRKAPTVAAKFQSSLSNLIAAIGHCNPYFVRCIKPNNNKVSRPSTLWRMHCLKLQQKGVSRKFTAFVFPKVLWYADIAKYAKSGHHEHLERITGLRNSFGAVTQKCKLCRN